MIIQFHLNTVKSISILCKAYLYCQGGTSVVIFWFLWGASKRAALIRMDLSVETEMKGDCSLFSRLVRVSVELSFLGVFVISLNGK